MMGQQDPWPHVSIAWLVGDEAATLSQRLQQVAMAVPGWHVQVTVVIDAATLSLRSF